MKNVSVPTHQEPNNFDRFLRHKSHEKQAILQLIRDDLSDLYETYQDSNPNFHLITNNEFSDENTEEILKLYEAYKTIEIIKFRDELFTNAVKCPYCNIGETETIDHYLPKKYFPEYALYSRNLVPSCYKCNTIYKGETFKEDQIRVFIHPYYDNIDIIQFLWVDTHVIEDTLVIKYYISVNDDIDEDLATTLLKHFDILNLENRYKKYGSDYISNMMPIFTNDEHNNNLEESINQKYLDSNAENGKNHWKTVLLKTLSNDLTPILDTI